MPESLQTKTGVKIGETYPRAIECLKYTDPEKAKKEKREE
jgi:hypothetical protein